MIREEEVYRIGRIGKAHGVRGELTMLVDDDVFDRVESDYVVLRVDGILVPFFMEEYRFKTDTTVIVKFEDVDTQERARQLTGCDVCFPLSLVPADDEQLSLFSLVGFSIVDANTRQPIGRIADIDDQTANVLFRLDDGRLIPAADNLVSDVDMEARQVAMTLPEGLLEL